MGGVLGRRTPMKQNQIVGIALLLPITVPGVALAQYKATKPGQIGKQKIAQIEKLLGEELIETIGYQEKMPLAKFLDALEDHLPKDKKIALRIDKEALGKDLAKLEQAEVRLAHFPK